MTLDNTKELPEDMYRFIMDEMEKKDENGKPLSANTIIATVRTVIQNHIEHRTSVTKETWESLVANYKK